MPIKIVTPQYVLASFSIVGSSLLLFVTLVAQATKQYIEKPVSKEKDVTSKSLAQEQNKETIKVIETFKEAKKSVENLYKIAARYEKEIVEDTILPTTPYKSLVTTENGSLVLKPYLDVPSIGVFQRSSNGLIQLQGMKIGYARLLMEIGIKSLNELSMQNPEELYRKILGQIRAHENNREWIPTKGMILHWIRIAKQT